jgi:hypothetical protein
LPNWQRGASGVTCSARDHRDRDEAHRLLRGRRMKIAVASILFAVLHSACIQPEEAAGTPPLIEAFLCTITSVTPSRVSCVIGFHDPDADATHLAFKVRDSDGNIYNVPDQELPKPALERGSMMFQLELEGLPATAKVLVTATLFDASDQFSFVLFSINRL